MDLKPLYLVSFFLSLVNMIIYFEVSPNKLNKNYLMLFLTTLISNFGYAMSVYATSLEAAMSGNLISYIGSIFTIMFMLVVVIELCNRRFFFPLRFGLFIYAVIISIFVATTKETNLFFSNVHIEKVNGLTLIINDNGPAMIIYLFYLGIINISALVIVILSIYTKKHVSKKNLKILLIMLIAGTLSYIIPLSLGAKLNLMPYTYILMEIFLIYFSAKVNTYDIQLNLINVYKNRAGFGYIAFDSKFRFLGCDDFALKFF